MYLQAIQSKLYFSLVDAQLATGLSQAFWRGLVQAGKIRFTRMGRKKIFIPASEIARVMENYQSEKGQEDGADEIATASKQDA